jgi:hypothetical protein
MDSADIFIDTLIILGFTTVAQRNDITNQGLTTCDELSILTKAELQLVFDENRNSNRRRNIANQVVISIPAKSKLEALRYDLSLRILCNAPMTEEQLTAFNAATARSLVKQQQDHTESKSNSDILPTVEVPKLDKGSWRSFRDAFLELLTRQIGSNGIPLSYITRESTVPGNFDSDYDTLNEKLINCIQHTGPKYVSDNRSVFSLLSTHLKASEGETTVKRFNRTRNGRSCWDALRIHFESESYKSSMKSIAISNIRVSEYTGPKKNFSLASLYLIHTDSHNMLEEAGLPYSESQKIQEFQSCLKEKTAIEKSVSSLLSLGLDPTFETYYNVLNGQLSAIITLSDAATAAKNNRSINELTTDEAGRGGRGGGRGRGRGRGHGRGRGRGRGGRGRGRGRGRGGRGNYRSHPYDASNSNGHNWQPRLGPYTDDEWYSLNPDQKSRIFDLRNAAERHDNQRSVNQVHFADDHSIPSQIQNDNQSQLPPPPPPQNVQRPSSSQPQQGSVASRGSAGAAFQGRNNQSPYGGNRRN